MKERDNQNLGTWIFGIGATEDLDSSGERIKIEGIDISSLTQDGVFNYEHKSEEPNQTVGKILEAKKILKKGDCDNERHEYFWEKAGQKPYLYVAGVLFDKFQHPGAISVAAMLNFDALTDKGKTKHVVNFSIEGSRLDKKGVWINKCIARKITVTHQACNKRCIAEKMDNPKDTKKITKESLFDIFKKCEEGEVDLKKDFKSAYNKDLSFKLKPKVSSKQSFNPISATTGQHKEGTAIKPKRTMTPQQANNSDGLKVGDRILYQNKKPKTGKDIYNDPKTWEKSEVKQIKKKAPKGVNPDKHERCVRNVKEQGKDVGSAHAICTSSMKKGKKFDKFYSSNIQKALVASCGMGAPSSKNGMEALSKEQITKVFKSMSNEAFDRFEKKDELIKFLSDKMPKLKSNEINALAKAVAYASEKKKENKLAEMAKAKVDEGKSPKEKKVDRAIRSKGFEPKKKTVWLKPDEDGVESRDMEVKEQKTKKDRIKSLRESKAKRNKANFPQNKDLEYPKMAASEKDVVK